MEIIVNNHVNSSFVNPKTKKNEKTLPLEFINRVIEKFVRKLNDNAEIRLTINYGEKNLIDAKIMIKSYNANLLAESKGLTDKEAFIGLVPKIASQIEKAKTKNMPSNDSLKKLYYDSFEQIDEFETEIVENDDLFEEENENLDDNLDFTQYNDLYVEYLWIDRDIKRAKKHLAYLYNELNRCDNDYPEGLLESMIEIENDIANTLLRKKTLENDEQFNDYINKIISNDQKLLKK